MFGWVALNSALLSSSPKQTRNRTRLRPGGKKSPRQLVRLSRRKTLQEEASQPASQQQLYRNGNFSRPREIQVDSVPVLLSLGKKTRITYQQTPPHNHGRSMTIYEKALSLSLSLISEEASTGGKTRTVQERTGCCRRFKHTYK